MADQFANTNKIVGEAAANAVTAGQSAKQSALVGWVMEHVNNWRDHRDENYKDKWEELVVQLGN